MISTRRQLITEPEAISQALAVLHAGGLVGIPTETVYGLAGDATNTRAVARIYEAKGRPQFNPLIVHCADFEMAAQYGVFSSEAALCATHFWPGPLTLVVPSRPMSGLSSLPLAGLSTVALRVPHGPTRNLIKAFGRPLAAPSANLSGRVSASCADHVAEHLSGQIELILDGGPSPVGLESTIISIEEGVAHLLRPGGLGCDALEALLGRPLRQEQVGFSIRAPGMMRSHYAPTTKLRLDASYVSPSEDGALTFGDSPLKARHTLSLSPSGDLREAAAGLFASLARFERLGVKNAAIAPIPRKGLGLAINDRLQRAAAPRF